MLRKCDAQSKACAVSFRVLKKSWVDRHFLPSSNSPTVTAARCSMDNKKITVVPRVHGTVEVPGDKSISHRAVILGALSNRLCTVENFLTGEDCLSTTQIFRHLGIQIDQDGTTLQIHGQGLE